MKKIILLFSVLFFSFSAQAQHSQPELTRLRAQSYADIQKSAQSIRDQKDFIRQFFIQMVLRKAQADIMTVMTNNGMTADDVQTVVESLEMQKFLSDLAKNPKILAIVDGQMGKLMMPGAIEARVIKQREKIAEQMRQQAILARSALHKSKNFLSKEQVLDPVDDTTLAAKVWDHLVDDLYKN